VPLLRFPPKPIEANDDLRDSPVNVRRDGCLEPLHFARLDRACLFHSYSWNNDLSVVRLSHVELEIQRISDGQSRQDCRYNVSGVPIIFAISLLLPLL